MELLERIVGSIVGPIFDWNHLSLLASGSMGIILRGSDDFLIATQALRVPLIALACARERPGGRVAELVVPAEGSGALVRDKHGRIDPDLELIQDSENLVIVQLTMCQTERRRHQVQL
jgi:hypothetical protein